MDYAREMARTASRTFTTTLVGEPGTQICVVEVPFDPKEVFGRVRAPIRATIGGHTFRTTIAKMDGCCFFVVNAKNRAAAGGVKAGDRVKILMEEDNEPRVVKPPTDLVAALKAAPPAWDRWSELSFTHQREWAEAVEGAKRPETRLRRIEKAVAEIAARPARGTKVVGRRGEGQKEAAPGRGGGNEPNGIRTRVSTLKGSRPRPG